MHKKLKRTAVMAALALSLAAGLVGCSSNTQSVFHTSSVEADTGAVTVPWDYRIVESEVGDIIGSDMTLLPDNTLLPNDNNYATGDKVWVLQFMDAEMVTDAQQRNEIRLSAWRALKTYKTEAAAQEDIQKLKLELTTELDLIGVYKTEFKGETRNFAVVELPSGNRIKQPIDDAKYDELSKVKTVDVQLEEIHDFADYDLAYAKFRGWAN
ncbi:signal peptide protein [Paenibacillus nanensis]|uniref:Signal peptide protein n=1 Tax=Paenibacillus nanensis TaxID=393251 RepID=A0A3A1UMR5_9BACL|nr:hypothetical protein [Paenibacillus nanensis]RIX49388.1 signal peptide protein [Paenibacillus nanensis]